MELTEALIFKRHLLHNVKTILSLLPEKTKLCVVLKANGYGNGAVTVAKVCEECTVNHFAVARVEEAISLRLAGIGGEILLLGVCAKGDVGALSENSITATVFDEEMADILDKEGERRNKKLSVFVNVDTGMTRLGVSLEKAQAFKDYIYKKKWLKVTGILTHFAACDSKNESDRRFSEEQFRLFKESARIFSSDLSENKPLLTASASSAFFMYPKMHLDMVRIGLSVYGYFPPFVQEVLKERGETVVLKPVMQLESLVTCIRKVKSGTFVSYGRTWQAKSDTKIAVVACGYADGLPRNFEGCVTINGKPYPVVGRICMDMCMVDIGLSNNSVKRWDKAIIFGSKETSSLFDAEYVARKSGMSVYEIMCGVSKRVKRVIVP